MAYAKKTCCKCGWNDIQPKMVQRTRYVDVAKGRNSFSAATVAGAILGDKTSGKKIRNSIFNTGQRTYQRRVKSWFCPDCAAKEPKVSAVGDVSIFRIVGIIFILIILFPLARDFTMGVVQGAGEVLNSESGQNDQSENIVAATDKFSATDATDISASEAKSGTSDEGRNETTAAEPSPRMGAPLYDIDFFSGDIFPYGIKNMTLESCMNWCLANLDCKGISYVPKRQECYPKTKIANGSTAPGVISSLRF